MTTTIQILDESLQEIHQNEMFFAIWLVLFNIVDCLCTNHIIKFGLDLEMNPLMNYLGASNFFLLKVFLTLLMVLLLAFKAEKSAVARTSLQVGVFAYFIVCSAHIYYIFIK